MKTVFRWAIGDDDDDSIYWFNLCASSLRKFIPYVPCYVLYNGINFKTFQILFHKIVRNSKDYNLIDVRTKFRSPFKVTPRPGVWWKWIPLSIADIEIHFDIDMFFMREPTEIIDWLTDENYDFLGAHEVIRADVRGSVGEFKNYIKSGTSLINVGLVGCKNRLWKQMLVHAFNLIPYGQTEESNFISEQGAGNYALQILELNNKIRAKRIEPNRFPFWGSIMNESFGTHFIGRAKNAMSMFYSYFNYLLDNEYEWNDIVKLQYFEMQTELTTEYIDGIKQKYLEFCSYRIKKPELTPEQDLLI